MQFFVSAQCVQSDVNYDVDQQSEIYKPYFAHYYTMSYLQNVGNFLHKIKLAPTTRGLYTIAYLGPSMSQKVGKKYDGQAGPSFQHTGSEETVQVLGSNPLGHRHVPFLLHFLHRQCIQFLLPEFERTLHSLHLAFIVTLCSVQLVLLDTLQSAPPALFVQPHRLCPAPVVLDGLQAALLVLVSQHNRVGQKAVAGELDAAHMPGHVGNGGSVMVDTHLVALPTLPLQLLCLALQAQDFLHHQQLRHVVHLCYLVYLRLEQRCLLVHLALQLLNLHHSLFGSCAGVVCLLLHLFLLGDHLRDEFFLIEHTFECVDAVDILRLQQALLEILHEGMVEGVVV